MNPRLRRILRARALSRTTGHPPAAARRDPALTALPTRAEIIAGVDTGLRHAPALELRRVATEQDHPRLWVRGVYPGRWTWQVTAPHGETLDSGHAPTHREALAVGLAALDTASMTGRRP